MRPYSLFASESNVDLSSTLDDLLISKSRNLIGITAFFFALSAVLLSGSAPTSLMSKLFGLCIVLGLVSFAAYRLMERHYFLAHFLWQSGLAGLILAACFALGKGDFLLLTALLPLIGAITLGWGSGLIAEILLGGLIWWVGIDPGLLPVPVFYSPMILVFGAFGGLLGWISTSHLMTTARWALFSFDQTRTNLEEARQQRLELIQAQADLSQANQELARLADRLQILQHVAEAARQAKTEFVANVSHELRTPLNMIIGFSEVISKTPHLYAPHLPAALMTDIAAIQRNSQHLLALVNDVLDLSQVEAGRMALSREWVSMPDLIQEAVSVVQSLFQKKGLYLTLDLPEDLPQVFCDQTRIRQVAINLLSNAGRFTSQGGVCITCRVEEDFLVVSLSDTGPGIAEEDQKRIFEPFQQVNSSIRRLYGGSGLGLTISNQFVELHGGKMGLKSQLGQGTTFYFTLPLAPSLNEEERFAFQRSRRSLISGDDYGYSLRTRPSRAPIPKRVPRLVVLEKEQALQRLLKRYFQDTEILVTQTQAEAAEALNHSPAQALLVNLPPFEPLSSDLLSTAPYGTPIITCWIPGEVEAANQLGVIQYLMKPLTREKLLGLLDELPGQIHLPDGIQNILVVDDEPDELHLFARMLESAAQNYRVIQVTNGKRALDMLRSRKPDIMLLDLIMPNMTGFQVLEEKRADPTIRDIPVIVISSRDPLGEAITSTAMHIHHSGGFSTNQLLEIVQRTTEIMIPAQKNKTELPDRPVV